MHKKNTLNTPGLYFENHLKADPNREIVWDQILKWGGPKFQNLKYVLDIAAGHCEFINLINAEHKEAIDWNAMTKNYAKKDVNVRVGDLAKIKMESNKYDLILASNIFEHLSDKTLSRTLDNILNALSKNGRLICIQPNFRYSYRHYFDDYTHSRIFTDKSLSTILKLKGFKILEVKPRFLPYSLQGIPRQIPKFVLIPIIWMYLRSPLKPLSGQMYIEVSKNHDKL